MTWSLLFKKFTYTEKKNRPACAPQLLENNIRAIWSMAVQNNSQVRPGKVLYSGYSGSIYIGRTHIAILSPVPLENSPAGCLCLCTETTRLWNHQCFFKPFRVITLNSICHREGGKLMSRGYCTRYKNLGVTNNHATVSQWWATWYINQGLG